MMVYHHRNGLQSSIRSCHFLKGDMNYRVPVTRYLGFNHHKGLTLYMRSANPKYRVNVSLGD
jgi:hypothetical protein